MVIDFGTIAAMLNISRNCPDVVYVDSDLTMLRNNDCTRVDPTPADKWACTEPKPRVRSRAGTLLTSWSYKRFCTELKLYPSVKSWDAVYVIKLSSLCGRVGRRPTRRLYNRSLCLLGGVSLNVVMDSSYERTWCVYTEMKELGLEQLQIKRLWERACLVYS